jgi:DNA polymerase alpha subunit A
MAGSIDNPSPPERLPSSIHTVVRPLGNWPPGFKEKASSQKSRVITAANEAALLSVVLGLSFPPLPLSSRFWPELISSPSPPPPPLHCVPYIAFNRSANIVRLDPDVIVGHDFLNVSLEVILQRMGKHRTGNWSKIGRFKKKGTPPVSNRFGGIMGALVGRLVCDLTSDGAKVIPLPLFRAR